MSVAPVLGPIGDLGLHAQAYAAVGMEVFPLRPDKAPWTNNGFKDACTDAAQITTWWAEHDDALIGHRIAEDYIILDIDPRHGGAETWKALKAEMGELPVTRVHLSGRGDGGGHIWWRRPGDKLSTKRLDAWAKARGLGQDLGYDRWTSGIDLLHRNLRYTILPNSPHPDTGKPYQWFEGRGLEVEPAAMPVMLAELLEEEDQPAPGPPVRRATSGDSIADWYSDQVDWNDLLGAAGWRRVAGNGNEDGSRWCHPQATSACSATVRHRCLFVWSTSTGFEPSAPGSPQGYTGFRAYALLRHGGDLTEAGRAARTVKDGPRPERVSEDLAWMVTTPLVDEQEEAKPEVAEEPPGPQPIDWPAFWNREHIGEDWLVHPLIPRGRSVALWATHKTGKSLLSLEVAAAKATGRRVLDEPAGPPIHVVYIDLEMTEDDLHERLADMGYGPDTDLSHLHYYLLPALPPLDTAEGGAAVVAIAEFHRAELVIVDTMARAVKGEENDSDTYRDFYRYTGLHLKARGIAMMRLDHGGKDQSKGQRGSSSKGDDVDVVWQLRPAHDGLLLHRDVARMSWVPEDVALLRKDEPFHHEVVTNLYPPGTGALVNLMEKLNIPSDVSNTTARKLLREANETVRNATLAAAIRWRKEQGLDLLVTESETP